MVVVGCDISTYSTGWGVVEKTGENHKIIETGLIRGDSSMNVTQRLYLLGNELKKIFERFKPDEIGIEEAFFMRGPKILATLSRFAGVAIYRAYAYQKKEPFLYGPSQWRKIIGISGDCTKAEVQLHICERFELLSEKQITTYKENFAKIALDTSNLKAFVKKQKGKIKDYKKQFKEIEKVFDKYSMDIYSDSGINNDMADSISIALAVLYEKQ